MDEVTDCSTASTNSETTPTVPMWTNSQGPKWRDKNTASYNYYCRFQIQWYKCQIWQNTSKIRKKEDSIETFGKFVAAQLCDILIASKDYVFRRARRKIQQVLMDAGDAVDLTSSKSSLPSTQLLDTLDLSHQDEVKSLHPVSLVEQSFSKNVIFEP